MIDVHCHILPGLDDGPAELEESLAMGRIYAEVGYRVVVATPHCVPGTRWMPEVDLVQEKVREIKAGLASCGLMLRVYPGMEIAFDPLVPRLLTEKRLLTLADGPYLLLECPFQRLPLGWEDVLRDTVAMGYKILLAHPERCAQLAESPEMIRDIIACGVYVQVNWDSLVGLNGPRVQALVAAMARKGFIHCLATDSHDCDRRSPRMVKKEVEAVRKLLGREALRRLLLENPRRVLKGEDLDANPDFEVPLSPLRRRWFRRLRSGGST